MLHPKRINWTASVDFTVKLKNTSGFNVVSWLTRPAGLRRRFNPSLNDISNGNDVTGWTVVV